GTMWTEWSRRNSFPDLVLVDGRFRVACCFSVALMQATRGEAEPPLLMMHDISEARPHYRLVFDAFEPVEQAETLVVMRPRRDVAAAGLMAQLLAKVLDVG